MNHSGILKNKLFLYLTEFFAGMSVMAVELGASRLLAPYFSSSQIVWTIVIGTIMIAMALANHPDLLIADEPTTALDVTIQHQILKQMRSLQEEYGTSIIFITHDLGVVAELCDRVVVLYGGLVMEEAEINDLFENPLHPYTMGLLASIPGLTKDKSERLQSIPGSPPDMTKPPKGCPFASRCQFARNICAAECPPFVQVGSRQARCWLLQPDAPAEGNPLHEKLAEAERKAH